MNKVKGINYLALALFSFIGLALEVVLAFVIEPLIYRKSMSDYTSLEFIMHWIFTCIIWGSVALILVRLSKNKYKFDIFTNKDKIEVRNWIIALILIGISLAIRIIDWKGLKVWKEFVNLGYLKFIFQYIYYLFETALFMLIIIFGQKAGEVWFNKAHVPWGGLLVGLTWGLAHALTKGNMIVGVYSLLGGMLYGILYLVVKKNIYLAYPLLFIMFVV